MHLGEEGVALTKRKSFYYNKNYEILFSVGR